MEEIIVPAIAGLLAGVGTGFAGLSAAAFIAPMLTAFLGVDSFSAIGIALASDVLASAASAATYRKFRNTDLKRALPLCLTVIAFAVIGTVASHFFTGERAGEDFMGWWLVLASLALGIKLLFFPSKSDGNPRRIFTRLSDTAVMILGGAYIGFVCGFQGTGGGMMLLFLLNIILRFDFKKSVGTSVFIMTLTALIGAGSHFAMRGLPDLKLLTVAAAATLAGAMVAAPLANLLKPGVSKRITGGLMVASGIAMVTSKLI